MTTLRNKSFIKEAKKKMQTRMVNCFPMISLSHNNGQQ